MSIDKLLHNYIVGSSNRDNKSPFSREELYLMEEINEREIKMLS